MMVSESESATIRRFVCGQLRDEPDLSTLTIGILKRRYLEYVDCESLSSDAKRFMKQVVEEELVKMQDNDCNESESETKIPRNKRKREKESDGVVTGSEGEDESRAKKSRRVSSSSSESEDKKQNKAGSDDSEEEEQIKAGSGDAKTKVEESKQKNNGARKRQISSDDSSDEEMEEAQKNGLKENGDSPKESARKKENTKRNGKSKSSKTSDGDKATPQSEDEGESDSDSKSEKSAKSDNNESSDDSEKGGNVSVEKKDQDSDSSSLPSLEDDQEADTEKKEVTKKKKEKPAKKEETTKSENNENKTLVRLKRYIALCGVRRNYKKLLEGCRSVRSKVAALKKELEDLGVEGQPTIEKCKKARMKREEAQELAELDVSNIITSQGRPKRRSAASWKEPQKPPSSAYQRTLSSGSDNPDQENKPHNGQRRTDWSNLKGIISDDGDSD